MTSRLAPPPGLLRVLAVFHEPELLGAGTSLLRAVPGLREFGWSVSGWVPGDGPMLAAANEQLAAVATAERLLRFSRQGWRSGPGVVHRVAATPAYLRSFRQALLRFRPHVVHVNTLLALPEAVVARRAGLPVVLQVHEHPPPGAKRGLAMRLAARAADVLVVVSDAVAALVRAHAGATPVLTVRNGVPVLEQNRRNRDEFIVGALGTVSRTKGTDVFARAAALASAERPSIRFEHAGQTDLHEDPSLERELGELLGAPPLDSVFALLGRQAPEDVFCRWDVCVSASRSEAFPLVTLEAMSAGIPVIATAVGGVTEQIEHLESGVLVAPDDPSALASWIVRLHDEPELRRRLAESGRRRVRERFTLASQASGLHRAYLTALNLRFGPPIVRRAARSAAA